MLRQFIDPELKNRLMARLSFSRGISLKELQMKFPDESGQVSSLLESLCESKQVLKISAAGTIYMTHEIWNQFQGSIVETVSSFHKKNPLRLGIGKEELRSTLDPKPDLVMLSTALDRLISDQRIGEIKGRYHLVTFGVHLNPEQQKLKTRLLDIFRKAGSAGLDEQEIRDQLQMEGSSTQPLMTYLVENNMIIRLPGGLMFLSEIISEFQEGIRTLIRTEGNLTVGRFRDHFGISRKQAVPLLEYFDVQGLTRRVQDHRVLR